VTEREREVLDLAIKLRQADTAMEIALLQIEFNHAVDMLIKERRDKKAKK
jgi:hypothetical protein